MSSDRTKNLERQADDLQLINQADFLLRWWSSVKDAHLRAPECHMVSTALTLLRSVAQVNYERNMELEQTVSEDTNED